MGRLVWPRFVVQLNEEKPRTFATFEKAERYARRRIADDGSGWAAITHASEQFDIENNFMRSVAVVTIDALDRVWTDMRW